MPGFCLPLSSIRGSAKTQKVYVDRGQRLTVSDPCAE